jgi:hypothetical protein
MLAGVVLAATCGISVASAVVQVATAAQAGASWPHQVSSAAPNPTGAGYWDVYSDGTVTANAGVSSYGDMAGQNLNSPIIGITPTPSGDGYWLLGSDGGIFTFGNAAFHGSTGGMRLNKPVVGMASSPDGNGYWLVASDGGIFTYGDAIYHGSAGSLRLNDPIVGMAPTPDGGGYWLVASDGGIFTYGDAVFQGSTGGMHLNAPIVGMAATPSGNGYWLVASDGGIFSFGDAQFFGSDPGHGITSPVVGLVRSQGGGYTVILANGQVATYQPSGSVATSPSTTGPTITSTTLASTTQGYQYIGQLTATGGTAPYAFSLASGALPSGLSLSSSGAISGLALAPDTGPFTVSVTDVTGATSRASVLINVAAAPSTLAPGQELAPAQSLWSGPNGYFAIMQGDGNFVIYNSAGGPALWASGTSVPGSFAAMQTDGNFVIYSPTGVAQWASDTAGDWGTYASMQTDSNFVLYGPTGRPLWDYGTGLTGNSTSTLYTGQTLNSGQELWTYNGADELAMQSDGNLVVYQNGVALWATYTGGDNHLVMQTDGNLVVYNAAGVAQWDSGTSGTSLYAVIQSDSNFVVYSPTNGAQWDYGSGLLGSSAGPSSIATNAVNWAISQIGSTGYGNLCLEFVNYAYLKGGNLNIEPLTNYGTFNGNTDPQEVWADGFKTGTTGGANTTPPYGALVFYDASGPGVGDPEDYSHVTIMGSSGEMISSNDVVNETDVHYETMAQVAAKHPYNTYVGWWLPAGS